MSETAAAVNASPVIYLGGSGLLELLRMERPDIVIPQAVWSEVDAKGAADPAATALRDAAWLRRVAVRQLPESVLAWDLGAGESAVIAWALANPGASVIIDDLAGRRCARSLGLAVRGTLGLVLRACRRGVVPDARATLNAMRARGMWLSDAVLDRALREAGIEP